MMDVLACGSTCSCANIPRGGWDRRQLGLALWGLIYSSAASLNEFNRAMSCAAEILFAISPLFVGLCVRGRIRWKYVYRESLSGCL